MKVLKLMFFSSLVILMYLLFYKIYAKRQAEKFKINKPAKKNFFDGILKNIKKYFPNVQNLTTYLMTKCTLLIVFCYLGAINYKSFFMAIVFGLAGFCLPDFMIKIQKDSEKKQIHIDLLNVVESLKVQMSSNIPLIIALKNLPDLCKNKKMKNALYDMYLEYELNGYSLISSLSKMRDKFKLLEMNIFLSSIEQQIKYGQALESYENLIVILKEKYIEYIENGTQNKMLIMTFGIVIVLINLAIMGCYPIFVEINANLSTMLA